MMLLFLITLAADQIAKFMACIFLSADKSIVIIPEVLNLMLVKNAGASFGLFGDHPRILLIAVSLALAGLGLWVVRMKPGFNLQRIATSLILAGAAGNWIDRLRFGAVIDFLDLRIWPAFVFNLADCAITAGVGLYLILLLRTSK